MSYQTTTINEIIRKVLHNKICLPSIQRKYVWRIEQIEKLFDSMYKGYPIGIFLIWELQGELLNNYRFYKFLNNYSPEHSEFNEPFPNPLNIDQIQAVLDGQQRITSIYLGLQGSFSIGRRPTRNNPELLITKRLHFNLIPKNNPDQYEEENSPYFRMLSENERNTKNQNNNVCWYPINNFVTDEWNQWHGAARPDINRVTGLLEAHNLQYIMNNAPLLFNVSNHIKRVVELIHNEQIINYFRITNNTNLDEVNEIFIRINSGGQKLSKADLLFSTVISSWEEGRDKIDNVIKYVKGLGYDIDTDFVMRTCLFLTDSDILFKVNNFDRTTIDNIRNSFDTHNNQVGIGETIKKTFRYLKEKLNVSEKILKSKNVLIPIIQHIHKGGLFDNDISISEIQKYIYISLLQNIFGSHGDTLLSQLRRGLLNNNEYILNAQAFNFELIKSGITDLHKRTLYNMSDSDIERFLEFKYGKSEVWMVLTLIYPTLRYNEYAYDIDHLHPRSSFKRSAFNDVEEFNWCRNQKDKILNLAFLGPEDNRLVKKDTSLVDYIDSLNNNLNYKEFNKIPTDVSLELTDFRIFIERRKALLKEKLITKLGINPENQNILNNNDNEVEQDLDINMNELVYEDDEEEGLDDLPEFGNERDDEPLVNEEIDNELDEVQLGEEQDVANALVNNIRRNPIITSISVNGNLLEILGTPKTTSCFLSFMNFCIDNYNGILLGNEYLATIFKPDSTLNSFSAATIGYNRVVEHNNYFYHTYQDSARKKEIIDNVAEVLGLTIDYTFE